MPCKNLAHLDKRYRERYDMSMIENLKSINAKGMDGFLAEQATKCQPYLRRRGFGA
jgi:hypothetical protein